VRALGVLGGCALLWAADPAAADEGGVSFWLSGSIASFAATPTDPGWVMPGVYYHAGLDADVSKSFVTAGNLVLGLDADVDLVFLSPTYTFERKVAGGQAAVSVGWGYGHQSVEASVVLTAPSGGAISGRRADSVSGGSDLYPLGTLKWSSGNHSWMAYAQGGIPVGAYQVGRLANLGLNHAALDGGGGYTYLDMSKGRELSVVAGFTYNFENRDTDYRNGTDGHVDWAACWFLSERTHVGVAGYAYYQLSGDSGAGAVLGANEARVYAIGPQWGRFFPLGKQQGYWGLRGYTEFGGRNRPEGWSAWLTLSLPLAQQ